MNMEKYTFKIDKSYTAFEFESHGPNGSITKLIRYSYFDKSEDGILILNLAFGDIEGNEQSIDDTAISNNKDRDKVLATVANSVLEITNHYLSIAVHATGSTPSRTRLYQMGINANKEEIETLFDIKGLTSSGWEKFEKGGNYSAFLVTRKKS